jgi:hypothetical protein
MGKPSKSNVDLNLEQEFMDAAAAELAKQIDQEVLEQIGWQIIMESNPDWHLVELKWEKGKDSDYFWNEACAWAIENFGLPGVNYVTHPTKDNMKFLFKNESDAILMTLKWI